MFTDIDCPSNWFISTSNAIEFLEGLYITEFMTEEELIGVIEEWGVDSNGDNQVDSEGDQYITYDQLVPRLAEILLHDK